MLYKRQKTFLKRCLRAETLRQVKRVLPGPPKKAAPLARKRSLN